MTTPYNHHHDIHTDQHYLSVRPLYNCIEDIYSFAVNTINIFIECNENEVFIVKHILISNTFAMDNELFSSILKPATEKRLKS